MSEQRPISQAAIHIELIDAQVKSVKHQAGTKDGPSKAIWVIECDASNQSTNLADIDAVLGDYRAQVTIEAHYEEPTEDDKGAVDPRQGKLADWTPPPSS